MTALRIPTIVATLGVVAALALPASAAAPTILLNLKGGYANQIITTCGIRHHYTFFHVSRPLQMDGTVQPAPQAARWMVKVKIKRCVSGRFRTVWSGHARGKADGSFKIAYSPRRRGLFFARAYYYGVRPAGRSGKQYFRVL
jgi:hypothetical protein